MKNKNVKHFLNLFLKLLFIMLFACFTRRRLEAKRNTFKANAIPSKVATNTSSKFSNLEASNKANSRKEKIQIRAMEMLAKSSLPPRMAMWEKSKVFNCDLLLFFNHISS